MIEVFIKRFNLNKNEWEPGFSQRANLISTHIVYQPLSAPHYDMGHHSDREDYAVVALADGTVEVVGLWQVSLVKRDA